MVDSLDATVAVGVVGARCDFADTQGFVDRGRKLGEELRTIIRKEGRWTTPERDETVNEKASRSFGCELCCGDGEHVGTVAKAVREKEDIWVSPSRGRERAKIVDADGDTGAVWQ